MWVFGLLRIGIEVFGFGFWVRALNPNACGIQAGLLRVLAEAP